MAKKKARMSKKSGSRDVNFEVVVNSSGQSRSIFDEDVQPTLANIDDYRPPRDRSIEVARKLQKNHITVHHVGEFSISASCSEKKFETFFKTTIKEKRPPKAAKAPVGYVMRSPAKGDPWKLPTVDGLDQLIEKAYIQHDPLLFANERPIPPFWKDKFRLRVPVDVAQILRATSVHKRNITGRGVRVVMPDTGFYHHPYFVEQGYNFLAVTAPDTIDHTTDSHGHGTGECANLFATAPGINFIGLKYGNTTLAIKTAVELRPDVITCSWGYSVDKKNTTMPNWLKPLYLAVLSAVKKGITVCFSAGNGHWGFPGSMPEVISVGGVVVDEKLNYSATEYTSGFESTWFPGRKVPDVSGLCGIPPTGDYIILPVQKGASLDKSSGWGAFSGTSAASPMVAGVCALLKEADPSLTPRDIKNILKHTARDITTGKNAMGFKAVPGPDLATGAGLVNAERAIETIL
ncbi:MAG: S8 family serine peptidase [Planctomycetota bacterium]|jgi:subtilisin family serine protease